MGLGGKSFSAGSRIALFSTLLGTVGVLSPAAAQVIKDAQSRGVIVLRPTAATPAMAPAADLAAPVANPPTSSPSLTPLLTPLLTPAAAPKPIAIAITTAAPAAPVAGVGTMPTGALARACSRPFARSSLTLGQAQFDRKLGRLLSGKPASAVVDLPTPYRVNTTAPAALEPWLSEVRATGGFVSVNEYCQESRGMFSFLKKMFGSGASPAYKSAAGYDAVLHTDGVEQTVTQIEFKRRAS